MKVYLLWFTHCPDYYPEYELFGIFASLEEIEIAKEKLKKSQKFLESWFVEDVPFDDQFVVGEESVGEFSEGFEF